MVAIKDHTLTKSFSAVRGQAYADGLDGDPDDNAPVEDWVILNGNRAIMGPAAFDPLRADNPARRKEAEEQQQEQVDTKRRDAAAREQIQEMENLAAWNARMTVIDGVSMTNEDAQKARKHIIEHEDEYARRAVDEGRIKEGDQDAFKAGNRRAYEIQDKVGRGTASAEDKKEYADWANSSMGRAAAHYTAEDYTQNIALHATATTAAVNSDTALKSKPVMADDSLFQSAPPVQAHFTAAHDATTGVPVPAPAAAPTTMPKNISATGFNV